MLINRGFSTKKRSKNQFYVYEFNFLKVINGLFMNNTYEIYLVSDSTGETLDRIFLALKAQFNKIEYKVHQYSFTRTQNQVLKI